MTHRDGLTRIPHVPSHHEIGGATAVRSQNQPTNGGDCHAKCEPRPESPPAAESAIVFGPLEGLPGKSRLNAVVIAGGRQGLEP